MGTIKILPDHVISKIAAGEVVERPASVVKELLDNAIDAGADVIEIDAICGGKKCITAVDNGCGMDAEDANLCVERHATSKISSDADLFNVRTLGFRGEALAAIAAISRLKIETKISDANKLEGTLIVADGGIIRENRAMGCPAGTRISVGDLFYNVPARQKFLKSDGVEYGHIADVIASMALAHSGVRFSLSHDGSPRLSYHRTGDLRGRIEDVLGEDVRNSLFEFMESCDGISLRGFVVKSGLTRSTTKDMYYFVNGRPVKDRILQHAVLAGFETFLTKGAFPIAVLYLDIDPAIIDVNVHPAKREVRFANGGMVHDFVQASVRKAVTIKSTQITGVGEAIKRFEERRMWDEGRGTRDEGRRTRDEGRGTSDERRVSSFAIFPEGDSSPSNAGLRPLGQLARTYIVCEGDFGDLVLIDQHAAHERLGFEELKRQLAKGVIEQQRLLIPEQLKLTPKELSVLLEHLHAIEKTGFELEPFGGETLVVKACPSLLGDVSLQHLFEKIAEEVSAFGSFGATNDVVNNILAVVACHRQVRAGDFLSHEEMAALVRDLEATGSSHCPHGRPAIITINRAEVLKWFKRA